MKKDVFKKNMIWNMFGSLTYVFTSMFFLIVSTRINTIDEAGILSIAFSLSSLLLCVANYATRTFHVTENKLKDKDFINHRFFSSAIMIIIALVYALLSNYDDFKFLVLMLFVGYKVLEAISEIIYAIMQKNDELHKVGKSLFIKGIMGIGVFTIVNIITQNLIYALIALISITFIIMIIYDLRTIKKYKKEKYSFSFKNVLEIFKKGFNPFLFTFLGLYVMSAPRYAMDSVMDDSYQAIFGILMMPATIIILLSQFMIQPFLISLRDKIKRNKIKDFKKTIYNLLLKVSIMGVIISLLSYFFGEYILNLIYGVSLNNLDIPITIIIIGASLCGLSYIISAALTTMRKTLGQSIIYIFISISTFFTCLYLVKNYEVLGATIGYLMSMIALFILYFIYFVISVNTKNKKKA